MLLGGRTRGKDMMRFSLKLLILLIIFSAAIMAWVRVRQEYLAAQTRSLANTDWHTEHVPEENGQTSGIAVNAIGEVQSARLAGPAGYAALRERPGGFTQARGLSLLSRDALSRFDPHEFPNLKWLAIHDVDYEAVSLSRIEALQHLQRLTIDARMSDPLPALATLPDMPMRLHLILRMDRIPNAENFPRLASVSTLAIHVPGIDEATLETIRRRLPECDIVVADPTR